MEGEEIWKDIPGFELYYQISNQGRIRRLDENGKALRILSTPKVNGYPAAILCIDGIRSQVRAHRLVMLAFKGECPPGFFVNHKNGIRHDNRLENLEYCTPAENMRHAKYILGSWDWRRTTPRKPHLLKITPPDVREIRLIVASGEKTQKELSVLYNVQESTISRIITGKAWRNVK